MSERNELLKAIGWLVPSRIVYTACQWAMLTSVAILTDLNTVGAYGLALATTTLIFRMLEFGINQSVNTDHKSDIIDTQYIYVRNFSLTVGILISVAVAFLVFSTEIVSHTIVIMSLSKAIESSTKVTYSFFRRAGKTLYMAQSLVIRGALGSSAFALSLHVSNSLPLSLLTLALAWFLVAILLDGPRFRDTLKLDDISIGNHSSLGVKSVKDVLFTMLRLMPLALSGAAGYSAEVLPRFFLNGYDDLKAVGILTALIYPYQAGSMIFKSIESAVIGKMSHFFQSGQMKRGLKVFALLLFLVLLGSTIGLMIVAFWGALILKIAYGADYSAYSYLFLLMAAAWVIRYLASAVITISASYRMFRSLMTGNIIMLAVSLIACPILIHNYSVKGAIYAVGAAHLSLLVYSIISCLLVLNNRQLCKAG